MAGLQKMMPGKEFGKPENLENLAIRRVFFEIEFRYISFR